MQPSEIYPFATVDGKAIPLDILKPTYLSITQFTAEASTEINLPVNAVVGMFISNKAVVISFEAPLAAIGTEPILSKTLIVPENVIVSSSILANKLHIRGIAEAGTLYIQLIEKWAGLALDKQFTRK